VSVLDEEEISTAGSSDLIVRFLPLRLYKRSRNIISNWWYKKHKYFISCYWKAFEI